MHISPADRARFEAAGLHLGPVNQFAEPGWANDFQLAMDAQPTLSTSANTGIPMWLTTIVDPDIIEILFAPNKAAQIFGEVQRGNWLMETAMFPIVEYTGEVSSYGDFNNNGRTGLNTDFPNRQAYRYQIILEYGELEQERAGLARIQWAGELQKAAVAVLNKYQNYYYFFGVQGLENYGLLNDPNLSASLTPAPKAAGGVTWFNASGAPNATANEVFNDIVSLYRQLVKQAGGNVEIDSDTEMVLAMDPATQVALTFTNTFGVSAEDMIKKAYPKIKFETAVQYAAQGTFPGAGVGQYNQGIAGGNLVQLIARKVEGQDTGYCAFGEKLRMHRMVVDMSSFKQKASQNVWGAVIRQPFAISQMLGV